jgi:molybdate transport system substrate-binding protein
VVFTYGPELVAKLDAGEPFDLLITGAPGIDALIGRGKLIADTRIDLFRSGMGVLGRPGASKPDISSSERLKQALLAARSVVYLKQVNRVEELIERLGLSQTLSARTIATTSDNVAEAWSTAKPTSASQG